MHLETMKAANLLPLPALAALPSHVCILTNVRFIKIHHDEQDVLICCNIFY